MLDGGRSGSNEGILAAEVRRSPGTIQCSNPTDFGVQVQSTSKVCYRQNNADLLAAM